MYGLNKCDSMTQSVLAALQVLGIIYTVRFILMCYFQNLFCSRIMYTRDVVLLLSCSCPAPVQSLFVFLLLLDSVCFICRICSTKNVMASRKFVLLCS